MTLIQCAHPSAWSGVGRVHNLKYIHRPSWRIYSVCYILLTVFINKILYNKIIINYQGWYSGIGVKCIKSKKYISGWTQKKHNCAWKPHLCRASYAKFYMVAKLSKHIFNSKSGAKWPKRSFTYECDFKFWSNPVKAAEGNLRLTYVQK